MHSFPVKAIKDTVNVALNTFGKVVSGWLVGKFGAKWPTGYVCVCVYVCMYVCMQARGMASTAKGVAMEALDEAKTIVKDLKKKGISIGR